MLTILYALHYGIPLYATSSYLHQFFNSYSLSFLYVVASIATLLASISVASYIKKFHTYSFTFTIAITEIVAIILFAITHNMYLLGLFFIAHTILQTLLYICLNIFIESFSKHAETGSIRGLFLALLNMGVLISPLIGGSILSRSSFETLYIVAACMLVPFLFFLHKYLKHIKEPAYHRIDMTEALQRAWNNKDLRAALIADLVLECFYSVMIIYSPIYLSTLGIPLTTTLTVIIPLALIPLVVLPYELGFLADKRFGEKELMVVGLLLLAATTFMCVTVTSRDPLVWVAIFLVSRIGASCVETMAFTYYFKKVGPEDASLTALFSNNRSIATIFVGLTGIFISPFIVDRPQLMFVILGCTIVMSVFYVLPMRDTR